MMTPTGTFDFIPQELRHLKQWVVWEKKSAPTSPLTGLRKEWEKNAGTYDEAVDYCKRNAGYKLGFAFCESNDVFGIDLDSCRDPESGACEAWAKDIINEFGTYTEISTSGAGIKLIGGAPNVVARVVKLKGEKKFGDHEPHFEVFSPKKYFALTGNTGSGFENLADCTEAVEWLRAKYPLKKAKAKEVSLLATNDSLKEKVRIYNTVNSIATILVEHGYKRSTADSLVRPGKDGDGQSVTIQVKDGIERATFWSTECYPFEQSGAGDKATTYDAWACNVFLNYDQDFQRAASECFPIITVTDHDVDIDGIIGVAEDDDDEIFDDEQVDPGAFPLDAIPIPDNGIVGMIVDVTIRSAMYPQPELAFAGALALMSVLVGRKVQCAFGNCPNMYILGLAASGAGKEQARKVNKKLLYEIGADDLIGNERIGSHAGIITAVSEKPSILFQLDEIGHLLAQMKPNARGVTYHSQIGGVLLHLYSAADSVWVGDAYADTKKTKTIDRPNAVIYGTCVPEMFWNNLSAGNVTDGLLGRMMVFEAPGYVDGTDPEPVVFTEELKNRCKAWHEYAGGNLGALNPKLITVPYDDDALERFNGHRDAIVTRRKDENREKAALWSRTAEKTAKLALIFACSRSSPVDARISLEDVDRAIKVTNWLTCRMLTQVLDFVSENEAEAMKKKLARLIPVEGIARAALTRKTQWIKGARERNEMLLELEAAKIIFTETIETNGRIKTLFKRKHQIPPTSN